MLLRRFAPVALAALMALGASADDREVYRWTDTEGNVHFSDRPLTDDAQATGITSRTTDNAALIEAKQVRIEQQQALANEEAAATDDAQKQVEEAERYAENCRRAKAALASILNSNRLYVPTDDGQRRYLDEQEVAARRAKAQANVSEWCK